jgi:hypothetical protein
VLITCVNHIVVMGIFECSNEVEGETSHERIRYHGLREQSAECSQSFSHELQNETYVVPIRATVLEVVNQMADVIVTEVILISVTEVSQDLSLEDVLVCAITIGTQDLHCIIGRVFALPSEGDFD